MLLLIDTLVLDYNIRRINNMSVIEDSFLEETIQQKLQKDLRYINNDVICKYNDKEYCKFSVPLNAICVLSFTEEIYIKYWTSPYAKHPQEKEQIMEACLKKLKEGTISKQQMIELVKNSKDDTSDKKSMLLLSNEGF